MSFDFDVRGAYSGCCLACGSEQWPSRRLLESGLRALLETLHTSYLRWWFRPYFWPSSSWACRGWLPMSAGQAVTRTTSFSRDPALAATQAENRQTASDWRKISITLIWQRGGHLSVMA